VTALLHVLPWLAAVSLFASGLWGIATSKNLVHLVVCLAVLQSSTYVVLLAVGWRDGGAPPVVSAGEPAPAAPLVDPVVQSLMLTDVVVGATVMALLLALAVQVHERAGTLDSDRLRALRG
jgi:multicomponent Na+:H+ antiporter subunit C